MSTRKTHEQFIHQLHKINPSLEVLGHYEAAQIEIKMRCSVCGNIWKTKPSSLLSGRGCPECGKIRKANALRKTNDEFVKELKSISPMIKPLGEYKGNREKVLLRCEICSNEWEATPHDLLAGHGCPKCGYEKQKTKQRKTPEEFLEDLAKSNPEIEAIDTYVNGHTRMTFKCKSCGCEWKAAAYSVLQGHGCPKCSRSSTSFLEQVLLQAFEAGLGNDAVISRDRRLIGMELDIVIPSLKLAYEPGSWAWHHSKKVRDTKKREMCKAIGYKLITIYTDYRSDKPPYDDDYYTSPYTLGYSQWDEALRLAKEIVGKQGIELSSKEWENIRLVAVEKSKKRTDEEFVAALHSINPQIEVLERYYDNNTKIEFRCLVCNNKWKTTPASALSGSGCPACGTRRSADSIRKTKSQIVSRLRDINPDVRMLGDYINTKTKVSCECAICGNRWEARPQNLLKGQGCPKCGQIRAKLKNSKTHDEFLNEVNEKNPALLVRGHYVNSQTKVEMECRKCGYSWLANPMDVLGGHGCPRCAGKVKRTNSQFIEELNQLFPYLTPLEEYKSANTKIEIKCNTCQHTWKTRPHDLLRSKGCPNCRKAVNSASSMHNSS